MLFTIFQITAILCFVFSIKVKMYKTNIVGFMTIFTIMLTVILHYLSSSLMIIDSYEHIHYLLITFLLIFISIYSTYKKYKRSLLCQL
jgi:hypothetical protein